MQTLVLTLLKLPNSFSDSNRHTCCWVRSQDPINYEDTEGSSHPSQGSEKTPRNKTNKLTVGESVAQLRGHLSGVGEALGSGLSTIQRKQKPE